MAKTIMYPPDTADGGVEVCSDHVGTAPQQARGNDQKGLYDMCKLQVPSIPERLTA